MYLYRNVVQTLHYPSLLAFTSNPGTQILLADRNE